MVGMVSMVSPKPSSSISMMMMMMMIDGYSEGHLMNVANNSVETKTKHSIVLDRSVEDHVIPKFVLSELTLGRVLGRGGFCLAQEVAKITLLEENENHHHDHDDSNNDNGQQPVPVDVYDDDDDDQDGLDKTTQSSGQQLLLQDKDERRRFMAANCIRKDNATNSSGKNNEQQYRYVIKRIQEKTCQHAQTYVNGMVDLSMEARFLSVMRHPNIIQMHAMANTAFPYTTRHFFIILDELCDVLSTRLHEWKKKLLLLQHHQSPAGFFLLTRTIMAKKNHSKKHQQQQQQQEAFWLERLSVGHDVSCAIQYLHSRHCVWRDVKPDNIGFDVEGQVKIFDFGLAKELLDDAAASSSDNIDDGNNAGTFNLTGDTGSPLYMAPEVALNKPYNETCDVYSFAILLWQILSVEEPFLDYSGSLPLLTKNVALNGVRPKCNTKEWPADLSALLRQAWHVDLTQRPSMESVSKRLDEIIQRYKPRATTKALTTTHNKNVVVACGRGGGG